MLIHRPSSSLLLLLSIYDFQTLISAVSSTSFCKCICGLNSTIIPLDGTPLDPPASRARYSSTPLAVAPPVASNEFIPSESNQGVNEIFDPADQGYEFPSPEDDYVRPRQHFSDAGDSLDFKSMGDFQDGYDHRYDPAVDVAPAEPTPSADAAKEEDEGSLGNSTETQLVSPKRAGTCNDCNRQFCLDHPDFGKMCGEAKEEEVTTTCFKRDSAKDQLVVYTFIFVTVGLLGYAAVRPWIEKKYAAVRERRTYAPVSGGQGSG